MEHRGSEISFLLFVVIVVAGFGCTLMSLSNISDMGAEWTLTRDVILALRPAAPRLDLQTCLRIKSLGCAGRRRGCRGGKPKAKLTQSAIPVVIGRRFRLNLTDVIATQQCQRYLRSLPRSVERSVNDTAVVDYDSVPSIYVLNAAALSKPHAVQQLAADLVSYDTCVAVITETHLKQKHCTAGSL